MEDDDLFEFELQPQQLELNGLLQGDDEDEHDSKIISDQHSLKLVNTRDSYTTTILPEPDKDLDEQLDELDLELDPGVENEELEDEDAYDKFVPTDPSKIEEYKFRLQQEQEIKAAESQQKETNEVDGKANGTENGTYVLSTQPERPRLNLYSPPENFSIVCGSIYRSSFPRIENFEFLKSLKLKSIVCLIPEDYPSENVEFNQENDINFYQIGLSGNKEPFVKIKPKLVNEALEIILDPKNHPVLIHCNRGKHRTGCIVGCIRKIQKWSLSMIFDEYRKFAYPKERHLDQQFIELFDDVEINEKGILNNWLPLRW
ncbi:unnamed protein product [Ambrosiozyma monospora]|uniref:Unnamed protein product n=1 Tax=Ambrosiozyma monospora TaxID=43982 RepID=A0ACB5SQQ3_AMBMO|nr:unnamed protein product [Ambrosiozyma monospora]